MPIRKAWVDALIEIGRIGTGIYQPPTDRVPEVRDLVGGAMQQIVLGKATPVEAGRAADVELAKLQQRNGRRRDGLRGRLLRLPLDGGTRGSLRSRDDCLRVRLRGLAVTERRGSGLGPAVL